MVNTALQLKNCDFLVWCSSVINLSDNFAQPKVEGGRISLMVSYEFNFDFSYVLFRIFNINILMPFVSKVNIFKIVHCEIHITKFSILTIFKCLIQDC